MPASVSIILDTRRVKQKTGKYPVKLLVTFERIPQRYQTIYDLSQEEFDKLSASRISGQLQEIRSKLKEIEFNADKAAKALDPFTFEDFEKDYILNNPSFHQRKSLRRSLRTQITCTTGNFTNTGFPYSKKPHANREGYWRFSFIT